MAKMHWENPRKPSWGVQRELNGDLSLYTYAPTKLISSPSQGHYARIQISVPWFYCFRGSLISTFYVLWSLNYACAQLSLNDWCALIISEDAGCLSWLSKATHSLHHWVGKAQLCHLPYPVLCHSLPCLNCNTSFPKCHPVPTLLLLKGHDGGVKMVKVSMGLSALKVFSMV